MTTAGRIRECRTTAGLSQAELSNRLLVSRQAVSKWESGAGLPDVENLKQMAKLFDVSVDHLLVDETATDRGEVAMRQPIDLASMQPYTIPGKRMGSRAHAAVLAAYPQATSVWALARSQRNTRSQNALEWIISLFSDANGFGIFGTADALSDHDARYLVESANRQLLVSVGQHAITSRELGERITGKKFTIGQDSFRRAVQVR